MIFPKEKARRGSPGQAQSQTNSAAITHGHSLTGDIARIGVNYHWHP
jgi:hypothetical protein